VAAKWFTIKPAASVAINAGPRAVVASSGLTPIAVLPWLAVGLPLVWGFWQTVIKAGALFR
jgi:ABC-type polysaccharide/polyol phosphate export permease